MLLRGMGHEGVRAMAQHYLDEQATFVGRADELARLRHQVLAGDPFALLTAPAGRGKTSLLLRLAHDLDADGVRVAWVPISLRFGTHRSATVEALLSGRLRCLRGQQGHWRDLLAEGDDAPLVVLLDGLDELHDGALLDALTGLALPAGVRLLAAARPRLDRDAASWATRLRWSPCAHLDLAPLSLADLADLAAGHPHAADAAALMARTGGDPLLVRACMESMDKGEPLPDVADPAELVGAWWAEQRARLQARESERAVAALAALGAAGGVVPWSVLAAVVAVSADELRAALAPFARFVVDVPGQGLAFAHPRFAEVARWSFPEATGHAQQRFAALARAQRRGADPEPYFLHFAAHHLEAAGAPDDDLHALISPGSLAAWRRHEGGVTGFLGEVRAAWGRAERRQHATWGTPEALAEVRRQAMYFKLESELQATEFGYSLELLAALVRYGLRSLDSVLASLTDPHPYTSHGGELRRLLEVVPDAHLPTIMALVAQHGWYRRPLAEHLIAQGLHRVALGVMRDDLPGCHDLLPQLAHLPDQGEVLDATRAAIEVLAKTDPLGVLLRLPLLPGAERDEHLRALEQKAWRDSADDDTGWPSDHGRLAVFHAGRGDEAQARRWLDSLRAGHARGVNGATTALAEAYRGVLEHLPTDSLLAQCREDLTASVQRGDLDGDPRLAVALTLAACVPSDESLALALPIAEGSADSAWRQDYTPASIRRALEERLLSDSPGVSLRELMRLFRDHPVADRTGFFARLPRWCRAILGAGKVINEVDLDPLDLLSAIVAHADEEHREQAHDVLLELSGQGAPVWYPRGWEGLFTDEEARALLQARLDAPLRLSDPPDDHAQLGQFAWLCHEQGAPVAPLRQHLRALADDDREALVSLLVATPEAAQGSLVDELLRRNEEPPWLSPAPTFAAVKSDAGRERLLEQFWRHWPKRIRDVRTFFHRLAPERQDALFRDSLRRSDRKDILSTVSPLWSLSLGVPSGAPYREQVWSQMREALSDLPGDARLRRGSKLLRLVVSSLTAEQVLSLSTGSLPREVRAGDLACRAWRLVEDSDPQRAALEALAVRWEAHLSDSERRDTRLARALATTRDLPPAGRVAAVVRQLEASGDASDELFLDHLASGLDERGLLAEFILHRYAHGGLTPAQARGLLVEHVVALTSGPRGDSRRRLWLEQWSQLPPGDRDRLRTVIAQTEGADLHDLEPFADDVPVDDLRRLFGRAGLTAIGEWWVPQRTLLRVGGPAALEAWGQGWLDALGYFEAGP